MSDLKEGERRRKRTKMIKSGTAMRTTRFNIVFLELAAISFG